MGYNTTGESHTNGISGEKLVLKLIRENRDLQLDLDPGSTSKTKICELGGTKQTADLGYGESRITVKSKKDKKSGTTDWLNTSRVGDHLPNTIELLALQETIKSLKGSFDSRTKRDSPEGKEACASAKKMIEEDTDSVLESFPESSLRDFIKQVYEKQIEQLHVIYNLAYDSKVLLFHGSSHPIGRYISDGGCFFLKNTKRNGDISNSRKIMYKKDNLSEEQYTGWRLRMVLNNGTGALLAGKHWSSNPSSVLTLKIQEEGFSNMVAQLKERNCLKEYSHCEEY